MSKIELVIKIDEKVYNAIMKNYDCNCFSTEVKKCAFKAIHNGTPLPKGHGRLIDENYLLSILRCEEYESCTWRSCSDCNREKCIKYCNIVNVPTIIEADTESEDKE